MTEVEVATKAPESDAQEDTPALTPVILGDTPAQTGPTMGEHCTTDRPTPAGEAPQGEIRKLGGIDAYVSKPASYPTAPSKLLLLLTGGTGLKSANNQIQSDKFAAEGFVVVMPDLFEGDPAPNSSSTLPDAETEGSSFLEKFKLKAVETAKSFMIDMWLARHTEEKVMPLLEKVIDACKSEFADAVAAGDGIYAVGYCFGARYILLLAAEKALVQGGWSGVNRPADEEAGEGQGPSKKGPFIKAGALAHATLVSPDDFVGLKSPISLVCVENDPMFPDEVRTKGEDMMSKDGVEHEVQVYPGVPHGFGVIGDYADSHIKEAQATAFEQMLKWVKEH
ncbi:Alpha/Beta hydrolase protein [Pseudomassariella vexata]|uniref:Alpha/Beta hydrolase protein n=1 Tax=Pseudomassariella vexata TaxID=1141098 RepID=A0A1Y2DDM0_9PEZI|nr:Alpha/Beta hydrolase protein [Pseudomassariella vexata]ORY57297.1 Alpha/Beta hydrolase protein [Pseudomassariella vexata]